jgi:hypothetical protein
MSTSSSISPTYLSWLNQIEIWFARLERQVIARGIFLFGPRPGTQTHALHSRLLEKLRAPSNGSTPTFAGESFHADEFAAKRH